MPDMGRRRQGRAGPAPYLEEPEPEPEQEEQDRDAENHKQTFPLKPRQQTRWREFQAAFQRPPYFMHASQERPDREREGEREKDKDKDAARPSVSSVSTMSPAQNDNASAPSPLPSPALPSDSPKSASEDAADPDATPKASAPSRSGRARSIFKVSSFLSLRNSNFGQLGAAKRKENGGESQTTTPLASPMEPLGSDTWRGADRDGSWASGSRGSDGRGAESDYFHGTPATTPTLHPTASNISNMSNISNLSNLSNLSNTSVPPTPSATVHDWKQWDSHGKDKDPMCLVNAADFTWHRPSFKQIIESLQVAVVSGDTVSPLYPAGYRSLEVAERRPSASQSVFSGGPISTRSKRRPSKPTPPSPVPAGPEDPIPGRYRSHIMCAIEGIHDMQASLDSANTRAAEAEESRVRDLVQFAGLSEEWAERERQYELEIGRLKEAMAAAAASPQPMRHLRMFSGLRSDENENLRLGLAEAKPVNEGDASAGARDKDTFMDRVRAAIESSSKTAKADAAEAEARAAVDKRQAKPALICDLQHDRLMSDRLFWELSVAERNRCRQRRRYAARDQLLGQPDAVSESVGGGMPKAKADAAARTERESLSPSTQQNETGTSPCRAADATIRKKKRRAKGVGREVACGISVKDAVGNALFNTSPNQSAPRLALGVGVAQADAKLVRWSTSQPFSPPGSEDDNSDEDADDGSASDEASSPTTDKQLSTGESISVSDCTVVCGTVLI